jgi:transcription elongation GreA/GreB family factor
MATTLTRKQITALAAELRTMLDKIEAGDLEATTSMRYRIEGAITALEVVLGKTSMDVFEELRDLGGGIFSV